MLYVVSVKFGKKSGINFLIIEQLSKNAGNHAFSKKIEKCLLNFLLILYKDMVVQ